MQQYNITETLRNYAKLPDIGPMFQCVLAEAAATIESLQKENIYLRKCLAPVNEISLDEVGWKCE